MIPQRLFRDRPRWNDLRGFGNSVVAKATIAIPLLGYMLLFNDKVIAYLRLHTDFCQGSGCSPSWRLYFFYFGCCFIAIGSSLYAAFCPQLIKRHKDAASFFESEKAYHMHPLSLRHLFDVIEHVKGAQAIDNFNLKDTLLTKGSGLSIDHVNMLAGPMSEHYYLENRRRMAARLLTCAAYAIGVLLLAVPTLITVWQVLRIVVR